MTRQQMDQLFSAIAATKVLVVGDLILDKYLWGKASRISPEAPVQVVEVDHDELRLGGAGNVVNNLLALGCHVYLASVVGADGDGKNLLQLLTRQGVNIEGVVSSPHRTTSRKSRVLASHQQIVRIDRECTHPINTDEQAALFNYCRQQLPQLGAVILSDYLKGVLAPELLQKIMALCHSRHVPVIVDPKGADFRRYTGATILTPNRRETEAATGVAIENESSLIKAGSILLNAQKLDALVLTRSEEGMSLFFADGRITHLPTEAREVFDVSGAGDTVVAVIGAAMAAGAGLDEAAGLANLAAGIVVGKLGTSTVTTQEILNDFERRNWASDSKILPREKLAHLLDDMRTSGKKIVFTNGCFDLLHAGHVKYLQHARKLGDLLVLGLNSDDSIRRLKGPKRPLLEQSERAQILAALNCVDFLTIFEEDTPLELLRQLRPDILVKGGDYSADEVVGKELVESHGGRVELIRFIDGKSTTNIINKVLSRYRNE